MCKLSEDHQITYQQLFLRSHSSSLTWYAVIDLFNHLDSSNPACEYPLNRDNPGKIYLQESSDEVTLAYKSLTSSGENPIVVTRRKYEQTHVSAKTIEDIQYFLLKAGFPRRLV